jgi:hypothetical protein
VVPVTGSGTFPALLAASFVCRGGGACRCRADFKTYAGAHGSRGQSAAVTRLLLLVAFEENPLILTSLRWLHDFDDEAERAEPSSPIFMKIVLQDLKSLEYVCENRKWTRHVDAAAGFPTPTAAADYAVRLHLPHVRLAMRFPYSAHNVDFPPLRVTCRDHNLRLRSLRSKRRKLSSEV